VYVDRSDVKLSDQSDFWGIAPGKIVGLKYAGAFQVLEVVSNGGNIM
jgi:glutaminyl-tRNA synthetase